MRKLAGGSSEAFFEREQAVQKKTKKQLVASVGGWLALLSVPPLALAWMLPGAWTALSEAAPGIEYAAAVTPAGAAPAKDITVLDRWTDTALHLTPQQNANLAREFRIERNNLASRIAKDRLNVARYIQHNHFNKAQIRHILEAFALHLKQERQLLTLNIRAERASGSAHRIHFKPFAL
jgi:hypothetical protein